MDFYSGITLTAIGIPTSMFTVVFALGRAAGWIAQWSESFSEPGHRISRPRQLYVGAPPRPCVPIEKRAAAAGMGEQLSSLEHASNKAGLQGAIAQSTVRREASTISNALVDSQPPDDSAEGMTFFS